MDSKYRIGDLPKTGMLTLALVFDGIQYLTPGYIDTLITAIAALIFAMIFLEKGALTMSGTGALKIFRLVIPMAELAVGHIPGILLTVWIQIKISRIADSVLSESAQDMLRMGRLRGNIKNVAKNKAFIKKRSGKIARVARGRYGKGRRGARIQEKKL